MRLLHRCVQKNRARSVGAFRFAFVHAPHALDPPFPAAYKFIKVKVLGKTDGATLSDS